MEFNVFEQFKGFERTTEAPRTPEEQGTRFFLGGHLGPRLEEHIDDAAARARMSRRNFLATASALPAAMLAVNKVTGMRFFDVTAAEAYEPAAAKEIKISRKPGADFIVDAHTHICTRKDGYIPGVNTTERGMWFVQLLDDLGKAMGLPNGTKDMTVENFGKLILEGSDTSVAIFNPFGFREDYGGKDMIPIEEQAEVKKRGWWFDDQKLAYPIWEKARKLGIKNIGCHKGIPFGQFMARYAHPEDLDAACDDFPDLNFIAYHSAWPYHHELAALKGFKPQRKNLYAEVGSTFAATVTNRPLECAHVLGTLLRDLGPDYVMWGTDSALWGNPQWQIEAFRKFQIPDQLVEGHGYPPLTPQLKAKVFGQNAARIWNLKTTAQAPSLEPRRPV